MFIRQIFFFYLIPAFLIAQDQPKEFQTIIDGQPVKVIVNNGDTLFEILLEKAVVRPVIVFDDYKSENLYHKYRRYAAVVYPYAVHAVRLYNQLQILTEGQTDKERRKIVKQISNTLEEEFETPLKNLTKTQGLILTKMIERQLDKPFYGIVKELKGGFTAFMWNEVGKMNGYKLKNKYERGQDKIMDAVLDEFDMTIDLE